jgi:flagellin
VSSLLTNVGAMTALTTLRRVAMDLAEAQDQIATGKRVADARDNASMWQIAATLNSDAKGFEALSTSLSLARATVGTARAAAESVVDQMSEMRERVIAATQPDADFGAIQREVTAMRDAIVTTINSAQVNGLNLLTNDGSNDTGNFSVAINRTDASTVATPTKVSIANQNLLGGVGSSAVTGIFNADASAAAGAADNPAISSFTNTGVIYIDSQSTITAGNQYTLVLNGQAFNYTAAASDTFHSVSYGLVNAINQSSDFSAVVTTVGDGGTDGADNDVITITGPGSVQISGYGYTAGAAALSGFEGTVTLNSVSDAATYLGTIEGWLTTVKSSAGKLASVELRIDLQDEILKDLTDSLKSGAGGITDADMEAAAARLQALQVQQQLGVQALSIANQQPQTILSLFQ